MSPQHKLHNIHALHHHNITYRFLRANIRHFLVKVNNNNSNNNNNNNNNNNVFIYEAEMQFLATYICA